MFPLELSTLSGAYPTPAEGEKNGEVKGFLLRAYGKTHYRIEEVSSKPTRVGMALVSAFIRDGQMVTTSTGDGRAYLIRV